MHNYWDTIFFGKAYPAVHQTIDQPFHLLGRAHRSVGHTATEAYQLGYLATGEHTGGLAGILHVALDEMCSKDKDFRQFIESSAKQEAERRRRLRQENLPPIDAEKQRLAKLQELLILWNAQAQLIIQALNLAAQMGQAQTNQQVTLLKTMAKQDKERIAATHKEHLAKIRQARKLLRTLGKERAKLVRRWTGTRTGRSRKRRL